VARGNASSRSDLDVLVEFERPLGLSEFLALEDALSVLVDRRVDLVTRDALKPYIGTRVLDEAVRL
jgi:predicted nucleotidyltransferase